MAEDSPNRFLWHEGEVEGESEDDDIPRECGIPTGICSIVSSPGGQQGWGPGKQLASPRKLL